MPTPALATRINALFVNGPAKRIAFPPRIEAPPAQARPYRPRDPIARDAASALAGSVPVALD